MSLGLLIGIVRGSILDIMDLDLPLLVKNPDLGPHLLDFQVTTYGLGPEWRVNLIRENGQPLPDVIGPGEQVRILVGLLLPAVQAAPAHADTLPTYGYGDEIRIEVGVLMDGQQVGGVSYVLEVDNYPLFLPLLQR